MKPKAKQLIRVLLYTIEPKAPADAGVSDGKHK